VDDIEAERRVAKTYAMRISLHADSQDPAVGTTRYCGHFWSLNALMLQHRRDKLHRETDSRLRKLG
jgi:hypothetical protein